MAFAAFIKEEYAYLWKEGQERKESKLNPNPEKEFSFSDE